MISHVTSISPTSFVSPETQVMGQLLFCYLVNTRSIERVIAHGEEYAIFLSVDGLLALSPR